jgi:hypothetical protein
MTKDELDAVEFPVIPAETQKILDMMDKVWAEIMVSLDREFMNELD